MLKPRALKPGDRVSLVSPASPFPRAEFDQGVEVLRQHGYLPVWEESVFERAGFVSGLPAVRAEAFRRAWTDPSIAALVAVRGGYGSVQILPLLDAGEIRRTPKVFVGCSDNTSLLTFLTVNCGVVGFHGPMVEGRLARGREGFHEGSWHAVLGGTEPAGEQAPEGCVTLAAGEAAGPLFGGTLTQLVASLGTPYAFTPPDGCVLFLEDVNERPFRLDRMLVQLKLAGVLSRARAIVWGEMLGCDEPGGSPTAIDTVRAALSGFPGPVVFGYPSGHTRGPSWTLPLGSGVRVIAGRQARLILEEAAVG